MTTATIRFGDMAASHKAQEHFAHTSSGTIVKKQDTERTLAERRGHEEWTQGIEQAWQGHLDTLQECVCQLLVKNQQLRMALTTADGPQRRAERGDR